MNNIINEDCLSGMKNLSNDLIDTTFTSPPFNKKGLYGKKGVGNQIWKKHEIDYDEYGDDMSEDQYLLWQKNVLTELFRITKTNGSLFYHHKNRRFKNKCHTPFKFFESTEWNLYQIIFLDRKNSPNIRNDILVPVSEYIFWLTKGKPRVYRNQLDKEYISEVWSVPPVKQVFGHPAPSHPVLPENCIKLTTIEGDIVFDPFIGIGTTAEKAKELGRKWLGFELSEKYYNVCVDKQLAS